MAIDRAEAVKKAEKLLRQGKLDLAIAEYQRMIEEQPRDWNIRNTLGDLYVRASQLQKAVAQYEHIADHLFTDGFFAKAAALYKKILKIKPDEESVQLHLADISAKQGLLADARGYLNAVANRRKQRGDTAGADEVIIRLGSLDPGDFFLLLLIRPPLHFQPLGFETLVLREVARIGLGCALIQLQRAVGHPVEKVAVVADHQNRLVRRNEELFQPLRRVDIEMIRRLVEQH